MIQWCRNDFDLPNFVQTASDGIVAHSYALHELLLVAGRAARVRSRAPTPCRPLGFRRILRYTRRRSSAGMGCTILAGAGTLCSDTTGVHFDQDDVLTIVATAPNEDLKLSFVLTDTLDTPT